MSPRPDVSEVRKNQIIEAATTVFTRHGFDKARMDDIVEESGLSKGTLYWYFKSKDEIIIAILDRIFGWEFAHAREMLEHEDSAIKKLELFTQTIIEDFIKMKPIVPIFFDFWALSVRRKSVNRAMNQYYQSYLEIIKPIIQLGIEQGEFRPVNVEEAAITISAAFEGIFLYWAYFPEMIDFEKQLTSSLNLLVEGLQAKS